MQPAFNIILLIQRLLLLRIQVPEAIAALEEREAALSVVSSLRAELADKQRSAAKAEESSAKDKERKLAAARAAAATLEDQLNQVGCYLIQVGDVVARKHRRSALID